MISEVHVCSEEYSLTFDFHDRSIHMIRSRVIGAKHSILVWFSLALLCTIATASVVDL